MTGKSHDVDVIVAGGGMVGAATACLLLRCGFAVAVVEARQPPRFDPEGEPGMRVSAISPGSARVLDQAGAWREIEKQRSCPYRRMHVEEAGHPDGLDFESVSFGLERLGTIVENDLVQSALWSVLENHPLVDVLCPATIQSFHEIKQGVEVALSDGRRLSARLLVAAEGATSPLRRQLGIRQDVWEYNQQGIVCAVTTDPPNLGVAWQRFLPGGPLAFLPLADGRSSMVWTRPADEAGPLLSLPDDPFLDVLSEAAEGGVGKPVAVGPRAGFPLAMRLSECYSSGRVALLGDSAHVVHPLAGQGVNLGLADAAALVETLLSARHAVAEGNVPELLAKWQRWRRSESQVMAGGTHAIRALFTPSALSGIRAFGLRQVGKSWLARDFFIRQAAGLGRNAPRMARGDSLKALLRLRA